MKWNRKKHIILCYDYDDDDWIEAIKKISKDFIINKQVNKFILKVILYVINLCNRKYIWLWTEVWFDWNEKSWA